MLSDFFSFCLGTFFDLKRRMLVTRARAEDQDKVLFFCRMPRMIAYVVNSNVFWFDTGSVAGLSLYPLTSPYTHIHVCTQDNPFMPPGRICLRLSSCWSGSLFIAGFHLGRCHVVFVSLFFCVCTAGRLVCVYGDEVKRRSKFRNEPSYVCLHFAYWQMQIQPTNQPKKYTLMIQPFLSLIFLVIIIILKYFFNTVRM